MKHLLKGYLSVQEYADKKGVARGAVYAAIDDNRITPAEVGETKSIILIEWKSNKDVTFRPNKKRKTNSNQETA